MAATDYTCPTCSAPPGAQCKGTMQQMENGLHISRKQVSTWQDEASSPATPKNAKGKKIGPNSNNTDPRSATPNNRTR